MRGFYDLMNKKFMQFGVFAAELSIDEQMVPYFGRHSSKMYIRSKPIRFGYKLWCLCSASGYLFTCFPYSGASDSYNKQVGLGGDVVLRLLQSVQFPARHKVYFDNFFTSYYLMCLLGEKGFRASGTVRKNRVANAPLKTGKELPRGEIDYQFDTKNSILFCRWQDNSEVTVCSNFDQIEPTSSVSRWLKNGKMEKCKQPLLITNYNRGMGGVDLHDNAVQNYQISIRAKKWYWPLWLALLNSAAVNAWKLHCFIARYKKIKPLQQKQFRVAITEKLLLYEDKGQKLAEGEEMEISEAATDSKDEDFRPKNMPNVSGEHVIVKQAEGKVRRCKLATCGKGTYFMCQRCNVHLHTKCFAQYHSSLN